MMSAPGLLSRCSSACPERPGTTYFRGNYSVMHFSLHHKKNNNRRNVLQGNINHMDHHQSKAYSSRCHHFSDMIIIGTTTKKRILISAAAIFIEVKTKHALTVQSKRARTLKNFLKGQEDTKRYQVFFSLT